jgi:hypothetical protein
MWQVVSGIGVLQVIAICAAAAYRPPRVFVKRRKYPAVAMWIFTCSPTETNAASGAGSNASTRTAFQWWQSNRRSSSMPVEMPIAVNRWANSSRLATCPTNWSVTAFQSFSLAARRMAATAVAMKIAAQQFVWKRLPGHPREGNRAGCRRTGP